MSDNTRISIRLFNSFIQIQSVFSMMCHSENYFCNPVPLGITICFLVPAVESNPGSFPDFSLLFPSGTDVPGDVGHNLMVHKNIRHDESVCESSVICMLSLNSSILGPVYNQNRGHRMVKCRHQEGMLTSVMKMCDNPGTRQSNNQLL